MSTSHVSCSLQVSGLQVLPHQGVEVEDSCLHRFPDDIVHGFMLWLQEHVLDTSKVSLALSSFHPPDHLTNMIQTLADNVLIPSLCVLIFLVRSKDYGSPNTRNRCYIVGVRHDVGGEDELERLCNWVRLCCPKAHRRASLNECFLVSELAWVESECCKLYYICLMADTSGISIHSLHNLTDSDS